MSRFTGKQWASKKEIRTIMLPSGAEVDVLEGSLYSVMIANMLPLPLLKKVMEPAGESTPSDNAEIAVAMTKILRLIMEIVVFPQIVDRPVQKEEEETHIPLLKIPQKDIFALIRYVARGEAAEALAPFRNGTGSPDVGQPVPEVQPETVASNGD